MTDLVTAIGSMSARTVIEQLRRISSAVIGTDINPSHWLSTARDVDRFFTVPPTNDPERFVSAILNICRTEDVTRIWPLTDPEVDCLSENRTVFEEEGITLCIPETGLVTRCRDKLNLPSRFPAGMPFTPIPTHDLSSIAPASLIYPVIAKPRRGRSMQGFRIFDTPESLTHFKENLSSHEEYVIQPKVDGQSITVDVVRCRHSGNKLVVARIEHIRSANGAGLSVEITGDHSVLESANAIADHLDIHGVVNVEMIRTATTIHLLEINPRFSAGVGFSEAVGGRIVASALSCHSGGDVIPFRELNHPIFLSMAAQIRETCPDNEQAHPQGQKQWL